MNSTVAMSAAPIGRPGWPELAFSTASMERKRIALAIRSCFSRCAHGSLAGRDSCVADAWKGLRDT